MGGSVSYERGTSMIDSHADALVQKGGDVGRRGTPTLVVIMSSTQGPLWVYLKSQFLRDLVNLW